MFINRIALRRNFATKHLMFFDCTEIYFCEFNAVSTFNINLDNTRPDFHCTHF